MNEYTPTTEEMRTFYTAERLDGPRLEGFPAPTVEQAEAEFDRWLARYRESVIDEVEDHLVRRDQFTERTLDVIDELRGRK